MLFALSFRGQKDKSALEMTLLALLFKATATFGSSYSFHSVLLKPSRAPLKRKDSVQPSQRVPPLKSVASFCHHLSSKWWKQKQSPRHIATQLPEEQKK